MSLHAAPAAMLIALTIEAAIGWPDGLYRRIGHPVSWAGKLISAAEARLNRGPYQLLAGLFTALLVILLCTALAAFLQRHAGILLTGLLTWPLVATRSLHQHVAAVAAPLAQGDIAAARKAVSMIVGRDPNALDQPAIARAALESLGENASDGVFAPLFWGALFGLPGIAAYKAINTLDSMIGHRSPRYKSFGWAAARIDDLANLIPARLSALLFALASSNWRQALQTAWRDARHHRSPNGGWPEAALAGALGLRLSGPRVYGNETADEPWINAAGRDPGPEDIYAGLALYRRAVLIAALLLAGFALWG